MDIEIIKKLSNMARVDMPETEMLEIADSFGPILDYVGHIKEVSANSNQDLNSLKEDISYNVLREDTVMNESGEYTKSILNQFPEEENGFLKVKQIL